MNESIANAICNPLFSHDNDDILFPGTLNDRKYFIIIIFNIN